MEDADGLLALALLFEKNLAGAVHDIMLFFKTDQSKQD